MIAEPSALNSSVFSCDAEPVAFAKYVLVLLRKDTSEEKLREICEDQMNVFLGDSKFLPLSSTSYF